MWETGNSSAHLACPRGCVRCMPKTSQPRSGRRATVVPLIWWARASLRRRSAAAIWLSIPNCMRRPTASMQVYVCCRMWRSQLASGFRYDCITLQPRLGHGSCCSVMIQFDRVNRPRCNWCWIGRSPPRCRTAMSSAMSRRGTRWAGASSLICVRQPGGGVALSGRRNARPWPSPIRRLRLRPFSTRRRLPGISRSSRAIGP